MSNGLGLLITTCQHYFTNIPNVIKDIEECNFPKENVLIVSGQESNNSIYYKNNIKIVNVEYTGLHLTGVIYLSENMNSSFKHIDYWVILPDTIKLGKLFYVNILKYYITCLENKLYSLPFICPKIRPTMDMGIIHTSHIYNMSDYLQKIKRVHPYSVDAILKLKNQLIYDENTILGSPAAIPHHSTKFNITPVHPMTFITNNRAELIERRIVVNAKYVNEVYFVNIDMYKYQRNFNGPSANLVMEL